METIALGDSGRSTTRLGFGCSSIMASLGRKDSLRMLETAFNAGIRHFDVAPSYGFGEAEKCLGWFVAGHKGEVTVTSKVGIEAPNDPFWKRTARSISRPMLKAMPALKSRLAGAATHAAGSNAGIAFTPARARFSLERSLSALRLERLDVWLLHEAQAADLGDDDMLRFLEDARRSGMVGTFGIGSEASKIQEIVQTHPAYCRVLQYEWSVLDPVPADGSSFRIHHRALSGRFTAVREWLAADKKRLAAWSAECGVSLGDAATLGQVMLMASLLQNPKSVILFSSKNPDHIVQNAGLSANKEIAAAARHFYALVQSNAQTADSLIGDVAPRVRS